MRAARWLTLLLGLALAVSGCDGDAGSESPSPGVPGRSSAPTASPPPPTPAERLHLSAGWGPSEHELNRSARTALRMSLPDLAGQTIVASYAGTAAPVRLVKQLHLAGVIAFSDNISSPEQIAAVNHRLARALQRPLVLTVDQEGGLVERVPGSTFPTFMSAGAARDRGLTRRSYAALGARLRALGFTLDLAPDADVTIGPSDPTIGARSAGSTPQAVAEQVIAAARGFAAGGVVPVLKHFPGHGSVPANSHLTLPVQRRGMAWLRSHDLAPFREAIAAGLPAVMVGHIAVRALDPGIPASLSKPVVTGLLRRDLGFGGVVMTDSLQMRGAKVSGGPPESVRALRAGADLLLMPDDPAAARRAIIHAVRSGALSRTRLRQAVARTLALLHEQSRASHHALPAATAAASRASSRLSAAAITSVAGPCRGPLVHRPVVPLGDPRAVANFKVAARQAGMALGSIDHVKPPHPPKPRRKHHRAWRKWREAEPRTVVRGAPIHLVGTGGGVTGRPVTVATDTPYVLGATDARVRLATFGATPGAMTALVRVLLGRAGAPGRLPVDVPGVRRGC